MNDDYPRDQFGRPVFFDVDGFPIDRFHYSESEDKFAIETVQDVEPIFNRNKALQTENDGYSPTKNWARIASIPLVIVEQWRKEGIDVFNPDHMPAIRKKLMDPDYAFLRTSSLGYQPVRSKFAKKIEVKV